MTNLIGLVSDFLEFLGGLVTYVFNFPVFAVLIMLGLVGTAFLLIRKEF